MPSIEDATSSQSSGGNYVCGWIEKMRLENFMCHSLLEIEFIDKVNFITGQNGSGKSAILNGLRVAFGTTAKNTERADTLKGLIKTGSSESLVSVVIRNTGPDAFEHEIYGDRIILERKIVFEGTNTFALKDERGKKVAGKKSDVDKLANHFNVDVDNPAVIMTQDKSRNFLHSGTPEQRFQFFFKATLLEKVHSNLQDVMAILQKGWEALDELKEIVKPFESELKAVSAKLVEAQQLQGVVDDLEVAKKRHAWSIVEKTKMQVDELERQIVEKREKKLPEVREKMQAAEEALAQREDDLAKRTEAAVELKQRVEKQHAQRQAHYREKQQAASRRTQIKEQLNQNLRKIQRLRVEGKKIEADIEEARQTDEQETQAAQSQLTEELSHKKAVIDTLTQEVEKWSKETAAAEQSRRELETRQREVRREMDNLQNRQQDLKAYLARLRDQRGNKMNAFGGDRVLKLLEQIELRQHEFQLPPIGPVGVHLSLKDDRLALAAEVAMGRHLNSFVVSSTRDLQVLNRLAASVNLRDLSVLVYDFSLPAIQPPESRMPHGDHPTLLKMVETSSSVIRNILIDIMHAESVVLVQNYEEGTRVAFGRGSYSSNIKECITLDQGLRMYMRDNQQVSLPKMGSLRQGRLKKSVEADVAAAQEELQELEAQKAELAKSLPHISSQSNEATRIFQNARRNAGDVQAKLQRENYALHDIMSQQAEQQQAPRVDKDALLSELQAQLSEVEREIEIESEQTGPLDGQLADAEAALEEATARSNQYAAEVEADDMELSKALEAREGHIALRNQAASDLKYYQDALAKETQQLEEIQEEKRGKQQLLEERSEQATMYCPREEGVPEGEPYMAPEELMAKVDRLTRTLETSRRRRNLHEDETAADLEFKQERLQKRIARRQSAIASLTRKFELTDDAVKRRAKRLNKIYKHLRSTVNEQFKAHLKLKGFEGEMTIEPKARTLTLEVKPGAGVATGVKDTRTLSGGERSFASLCYALTLHENVEAPFRAMDEFDIFMDDISRKMCLQVAVDFAIKQGSQWIFITPHDISSVEAGPYVKKQQMAAPRP